VNLITQNRPFYREMLKRDRLFPFVRNGRLVCFIVFYICNKNDIEIFVNTDPWKVIDDSEDGDTCYISQLLTDKHSDNPKLSYEIWHKFKKFIKLNYPKIETIRWNRFNKKTKKVKPYKEKI